MLEAEDDSFFRDSGGDQVIGNSMIGVILLYPQFPLLPFDMNERIVEMLFTDPTFLNDEKVSSFPIEDGKHSGIGGCVSMGAFFKHAFNLGSKRIQGVSDNPWSRSKAGITFQFYLVYPDLCLYEGVGDNRI